MSREQLGKTKRLVVKVGTGSLADGRGIFDRANCERLATEMAAVARDRKLVLVSSGAVALGAERLGLTKQKGRPWDIPTKQACAATGQPYLMAEWDRAFAPHGRKVAQILLTADDLAHRTRFLNARHTIAQLLDHGVVPVVNENDTVSVDEIRVGDNDSLAALVATCLEAELVVLMTDVEGLYDKNPSQDGATLLPEVTRVTAEIEKLAGDAGGAFSTGGMMTKVRAAKGLAARGISMALVSGRRNGALSELLAGRNIGTYFPAHAKRSEGRKGWLALAARGKGEIVVDAGARKALSEQGRSLLASGVKDVTGTFVVGDPVEISVDPGRPFARGLAGYGAEELKKIRGLKTPEIEKALGYKYLDEVVHRNDLVLLE